MVRTMAGMSATRKTLLGFEHEIREILPKVDGIEDVVIFRRSLPLEEFPDSAVVLRIRQATLDRAYPVSSADVMHRIITPRDCDALF